MNHPDSINPIDTSAPQNVGVETLNEGPIKKTPPFAQSFVCGAVSGMVSVAIGQPVELVKIRMQTYPQKYTSVSQSIRKIAKNEGFPTFYKGTMAPLLGQGLVFSVQFGTYQSVTNSISVLNQLQGFDQTISQSQNVMAGAIAGATTTIINSPLELVRIKIQLQKYNKYSGPIDCFQKILSHQGLTKGLFRGYQACLLRDMFYGGALFGTYLPLKKKYVDDKEGISQTMRYFRLATVGAASGIAAWTVCYPFDIIKSMIQGESLSMPRHRNNTRKFMKIMKTQGATGFYTGLSPCLLRAAISFGASFPAYEMMFSATDNYFEQ